MSCWCTRAEKAAEPELELPALVMPSDMLRSFFTRIKLQVATLESTTMERQESAGICPEGFDDIANELSAILEREIAGVRDSYLRSIAIYRSRQQRGESVNEFDRVHAARSKLAMLLSENTPVNQGPRKMRITAEAPRRKVKTEERNASTTQTPSTADS